MCKARLEAPVPDDFWPWLEKQGPGLMKSLFATFPVNSNQVLLFQQIREAVGEAEFDRLKMSPFAVALSFLNRFKSFESAAEHPHPEFEINGYNYLKHELAEAKKAMSTPPYRHTNIQSNECRSLIKCNGQPNTWKFKWPRDPSPSVKEWALWRVQKQKKYGTRLWGSLSETPWIFGVYVWPSPLEECEWVQRKVLEGERMPPGCKWYKYADPFHQNFKNPQINPDALGGIACYGGVCGRMAQLEWRKTSCMGMPATMKSEEGHCAGFKMKPKRGRAGKSTWSYDGIHEIGKLCTRSNCHFYSATAKLDEEKNAGDLWGSTKQHRSAMQALLSSYNRDESSVWPTKFDESRLAASAAIVAKKSAAASSLLSSSTSTTAHAASTVAGMLAEGALGWALDQHPASYEVWEALADMSFAKFPAAPQQLGPLPREQGQTTLIQLETGVTARVQAAAERFALERLVSKQHASFLAENQGLRSGLVRKVCQALNGNHNGLLSAANQTWVDGLSLRQLLGDCSGHRSTDDLFEALKDLADHQAPDGETRRGNVASGEFSEKLRELRGTKEGQVAETLRDLLKSVSVGYVNARSEEWFRKHKRVLLRGPYVRLLRLAGMILEEEERRALHQETRYILEHPEKNAKRILAEPSGLHTKFIEWVAKQRSDPGTAEDEVMFKHETTDKEEIEAEFLFDVDKYVELGEATQAVDGGDQEDGEKRDARHDVDRLLRRHLRLQIDLTDGPPEKDDDETDDTDDEEASAAVATKVASSEAAAVALLEAEDQAEDSQAEETYTVSEAILAEAAALAKAALQTCVEDVESRLPGSFWNEFCLEDIMACSSLLRISICTGSLLGCLLAILTDLRVLFVLLSIGLTVELNDDRTIHMYSFTYRVL